MPLLRRPFVWQSVLLLLALLKDGSFSAAEGDGTASRSSPIFPRHQNNAPPSPAHKAGGGGGRRELLDLQALAAWPSPKQLKLLSTLTPDDYMNHVLPSMADQMDPSTAAMVFESFPFLKTMPDYQAFLKSDDSTDPDKKGAAQVSAVQALLSSAWGLSQDMAEDGGEGGPAALATRMIEEDPSLAGELSALQEHGDKAAFRRLQQAFADKHLAGVDVSALYDNTFVDQSRQALKNDQIMRRVIGEDSVLRILDNPDVRLLDPTSEAAAKAGRRLQAATMASS